jgi:PAS domain S-box-containing protein
MASETHRNGLGSADGARSNPSAVGGSAPAGFHPIRNLSIARKLKFVFVTAWALVLLLTTLVFLAYEWYAGYADVRSDLQARASLLAVVLRPALASGDDRFAASALNAVRANADISRARVYGGDGRLIASYDPSARDGVPPAEPPAKGPAPGYIGLTENIEQDGHFVGTLFLESAPHSLASRFAIFGGIALGASVLALGFMFWISKVMRALISEPILELSQAVGTVADGRDYSVRATPRYPDEVGRLAEAFNDLISHIADRDRAITDSETYFRALIESASDLIVIIDAAGKITYESPSVFRILDYPLDAIRGQKLSDLVHPEDLDSLHRTLGEIRPAAGQMAPVELRLKSRTGRWVPCGAIFRNLLQFPAISGIVINARDITELKAAEDRLRTYAGRLERSNQALQDFAHIASHDLQEPLRKIQAFSERLTSRFGEMLGDQGRDFLRRMQSAAIRMQELISGLLQFSRVTTQAKPFEPIDLNAITRDVLSDLEARIESTHGRIAVAELPSIEADPLQMRQLIQNLVGNALKFHRPDVPPLVEIEGRILPNPHAEPGERNGHRCELIVRDNGIGFDESQADKIFTIFQRLHSASEYEGNGVGLAICQKIVERHGGTIAAHGRPGEGSTFVIDMPVHHEEAPAP